MKTIEIVMGFSCNARCAFCFVPPDVRGFCFTPEKSRDVLAHGRENGAEAVYFGGGEPTIRKELLPLILYAKELGYETISLKTNGMIFCYPDHAKRALAAGANSFTIPIWGPAELHDRYACVPRAFERTEMAVKNLLDFGARVELDLLVTRSNMESLAGSVERFAAAGVRNFSLWYISLFGMEEAGADMAWDLPRYAEALPFMRAAMEAGKKAGAALIRTSHVPPCLMSDIPEHYTTIREMDLLIVAPGNSFRGEESPFESGAKVAACDGCRLAGGCLGIRGDYLRVHGAAEFAAVK